jgi:GT2 family glycosyltransferase
MNAQKLKERLTKKEYCDVQKGIIPIQSATFVSLFLNSDAVKKAGLPLKEYFIWGDDKEYTLRISKQYPCYLVSSSVVTHKMNSNNGSNLITDDKVRIGRYRYAYRNDLATAKKNGGKEILSYYFYFFKTMIHIIRFSPSYKLLRLFTLFRGMLEGIAFYPKTEFMQNER